MGSVCIRQIYDFLNPSPITPGLSGVVAPSSLIVGGAQFLLL